MLTKKTPVISIVTVVFNGAKTLRATIESVVPQLNEDVEYIIIDGGSSDGTQDIIQEYSRYVEYWVSEPDRGIYNAMNKGLVASRGEYVHFLNAGDTYVSADCIDGLRNVVRVYRPKYISYTVEYLMPNGDVRHLSMVGDVDTICHPGLVVRADLYKKNMFNEGIRYASDIEFFLRVINREDVYIADQKFVAMPSGGVGGSAECLVETVCIYVRYRRYFRAFYSITRLLKCYVKSFALTLS